MIKDVHGGDEKGECKDVLELEILDKCCKIPGDLKMPEEHLAAAQSCHKSIGGDKPMPTIEEERKEIIECLEECYFKETNLLTPDLKLNGTAIISTYSEQFSNYPKWAEAVTVAAETCLKEDVTKEVKPSAKCKSGTLQYFNCFSNQLFLHCPEDSWQAEDEACVKAKEMVDKCKRSHQ